MSDQIPAFLEPLMCNCAQPNKVGYSSLHPDYQHWLTQTYGLGKSLQYRIERTTPLGMFCTDCMKPIGFTILNAVKTCEGCGKYYVPKPVPESYPIKQFLCQKCDIPVRSGVKRVIIK